MLDGIHGLIFQQAGPVQRRQKILFHPGKIAAGNRGPGDEDQFNGPGKFMLMLPETFAKQAPGAAAGDGVADALARHHAQFRRRAVRQAMPVGNQAAQRQPLTPLPYPREITVLTQS